MLVEKAFTKLETKMEHLEARLGIGMIAGFVVTGVLVLVTRTGGGGHAPHS